MRKNRVFMRRPCMFVANIAGLCFVLAGVIGCKGQAEPEAPAASEASHVSGQLADSDKSNWGPIRKHADNPHYFAYKGKPLVLITTDHHYGAVINLDFDYVPFLDRLHEYGMNLTRIYPGAYVEMKDQYAKGNPLGPSPGRYILPWRKSTVAGANLNLGVYKYDLDSWDEEYFKRLKDYVYRASLREIIVEIA